MASMTLTAPFRGIWPEVARRMGDTGATGAVAARNRYTRFCPDTTAVVTSVLIDRIAIFEANTRAVKRLAEICTGKAPLELLKTN